MAIWKKSTYFMAISDIEDKLSENFHIEADFSDYIDYDNLELDIFCDGDDELFDDYMFCIESVCTDTEDSNNFNNPCLTFRIWDDFFKDFGKINLFMF